jgi:hypothetical protein
MRRQSGRGALTRRLRDGYGRMRHSAAGADGRVSHGCAAGRRAYASRAISAAGRQAHVRVGCSRRRGISPVALFVCERRVRRGDAPTRRRPRSRTRPWIMCSDWFSLYGRPLPNSTYVQSESGVSIPLYRHCHTSGAYASRLFSKDSEPGSKYSGWRSARGRPIPHQIGFALIVQLVAVARPHAQRHRRRRACVAALDSCARTRSRDLQGRYAIPAEEGASDAAQVSALAVGAGTFVLAAIGPGNDKDSQGRPDDSDSLFHSLLRRSHDVDDGGVWMPCLPLLRSCM